MWGEVRGLVEDITSDFALPLLYHAPDSDNDKIAIHVAKKTSRAAGLEHSGDDKPDEARDLDLDASEEEEASSKIYKRTVEKREGTDGEDYQ